MRRCKIVHRITAVFMAAAMIVTGLTIPAKPAEAAETEYEIYPSPHVIEYGQGDYIIKNDVNIVYESGIDQDTKNRLKEAMDLKADITATESEEIVEGKTNILVGIAGSQEYVDAYADKNIEVTTDGLYDKRDSYVLDSDNGVITVLGKDTDSSFYGLTTLYHILKQMDSYTIRNFHIEDWADVASRGFIEGYYGNPWSTQDRINLMKWGGYYKLNSYFYAPKNDQKHNSNWRALYTDEEIDTLIKPLAQAGNSSKCRFVFALHTFMYNPIRFDTEEHYQEDLQIVKDKFTQVIEAGVRQIAILADDADNVGADNYVRFLEDMTAWIKEMQKIYPDLKSNLPFCTVEYMYNGESYYQRFPEDVQIVMTGGRIWGEVSTQFTEAFTKNAGRGPYMWVNWPCTDNSKSHLIMGGYSTFLHPGVDPAKIQGIVLNPMQQSEPSKVAIFGNACYSWNIWESANEADQAWNDSFKYVDHNSAIDNEASNAFRELSKHMINQNMDGRVTALQESVELAPKLNSFKDKLNAGTVTEEDIDAIIKEFEILQNAADVYEAQAGDLNVKDQIIYWLDCWDDTTDAAIAYLNGVKAVLSNDTTAILKYNADGKTAFDKSKTHAFWYLNNYEYAEVGVQHIVPFIKTLGEYVSKYAETAMNPDAVIATYITSRADTPAGGVELITDGSDSTKAVYKNPNQIVEGEYIGMLYNRVIDITDIRFLLDAGKDHFDHSRLEYTEDGKTWKPIELVDMENAFAGVSGKNLEVTVNAGNLPENFKAMGIRLIATADNVQDAWLGVCEIQINKSKPEKPEETERYTGEVTYDKISVRAGKADNYFDGDVNSELQLAKAPYEGQDRDRIPENAAVTITFDEPKTVGTFRLVQGMSAAADVFADATLQYKTSKSEEWTNAGDLTNRKDQTIDLGNVSDVVAMRILNNTATAGWVRIGEIDIREPAASTEPIQYNVIRTDRWSIHKGEEGYLHDGNDDTYVWYDPDGSGNTTDDDFMAGDYLGYDLGKVAELESAHIVVGHDDSDKLKNYAIETSVNNETWTPVKGYENYTGADSGKDILNINLEGTRAQYIRIKNLTQKGSWAKFSEFTVKEKQNQEGTTENLYTNVKTDILSNAEEGKVSLTSGDVTLNKEDYIGIDLGNIKAVTSVTVSQLPENADIQTSLNGIDWTEYTQKSKEAVDARYIRVVSKAADVTFNIDKYEAEFAFIADKSVESNFATDDSGSDMRTQGTVGKVFDGDLTTYASITGEQEAGKHVTFDLGQTIHFESFRYYIVETQKDYPRNVDFEVSTDGKKWTKILGIHADVENAYDETTAKDMQDISLWHDTNNPGYMYAEATGLNVDGRYIRVTPTESYSYRWLGFSELLINNGEYVTTESNRDVITEAIEEEGKIPSNMLDGDYSTVYKSSKKNSSFTYRLSDPAGVKSFRLIQLGEVSDAEVTVSYIGEEETEKLGILNQAIKEFLIPAGKTLKSITVTWKDVVPEITEITVSREEPAAVNKDELKATLDEVQATGTWTRDSVTAYEEAKAVAQEVYNNANVSQAIVDSALGTLKAAIENTVLKAANIDELKALVDGKISNDGNIYANVSYSAYDNAVNALAAALEDADNLSQTKADTLKVNVETAAANLTFSTRNRELAELAAETYDAFVKDNYTEASYQAMTDAKNSIDILVAQDKAAENGEGERVNPQVFAEAKAVYEAAKAGLVDVTALKAEIEKAAGVDGSLYTEESYQAYMAAVEEGKTLLANGTADQVAAAVQAIQDAFGRLETKPDLTLDEIIAQAKALDKNAYTTDSYNALMAIVGEAEASGDDSYIAKIQKAMNDLVNVTALKARIEEAEAVNPDTYTVSSYGVLSDLLEKAQAALKSGTKAEVDKMTSDIADAVKGLEVRAAGIEDYINSIKLKQEKGYTAESYKAYLKAYNALKNADPADLSAEEFARLKDNFEKAELGLKLAGQDKPGTGGKTDHAVNTGDEMKAEPIILVLVLCVIAVAAVVIIRKRQI